MIKKILKKEWSGGNSKWGYWDCQVEHTDKKGNKVVVRECLYEVGVKEIEFKNYLRKVIKASMSRKKALEDLEKLLDLKYEEGRDVEIQANAGADI